MTGATAEVVAAVLLVLSLGFAVLRPRGITEAAVAVPAAVLVVLLGIVPGHAALDTLRGFGPTVAFLAAILVFGHLCAEAGVFTYLGATAARLSGGDPPRLLGMVVALAAATTATLTLDATVVLLTPVVLATAARLAVPARPFAYACTRLANSGSLLLPVSNLTNLLAFGAAGLSFGRFGALMLLPWLVMCAGEWLALRVFFRGDLAGRAAARPDDVPPPPRYALVVLAATVASFVVASAVDVAPAWAALAGCVALLVPRLRGRDVHPWRLVGEASPGFCAFVLALAVVVDGVTRHGLHDALTDLVPSGTSFVALLALAALAAVLANAVNNLPATLALLPVVTGNPALVLAVLIGVNVGPNATYPGSLATLLWRRLLPADDKPRAGEFHRLGLLTVPVLVVAATAALWVALHAVGV
ncbi:arsenite efflux membrane protein ArsB [Jatrophihabitans endophyticus]|uniref:Arsenite efflux membrane protein ArsB n=1 Tax=Jatrophihabitans endophyticus TaxID=1206085 RepID=A0A1M5KTN0_9ACTN|nr:SLC13 family permease [Jatrophihabitans endophyticus]SHG56086.1 arsenite efflux membrane protein ArsB [Jatrophihabitans endophyticus]